MCGNERIIEKHPRRKIMVYKTLRSSFNYGEKNTIVTPYWHFIIVVKAIFSGVI